MSGLRPTTPKLSSRPRPAPATSSKLNPTTPSSHGQGLKSPPLTTSQNANAPSYPFLNHSPGHYLAPKEGSARLKIKATTTPEAKSRLMKTPLASVRRTAPGMTSSDSSDSMSWIPPTPINQGVSEFRDMYDGEEEVGQTEAVMVSVRVRPPNPVEMQKDGECIWTTSPYEPQLLKLNRGTQIGRDDREWTYDRILPQDTDNSDCYATSARSHVRSSMEGYNAVIFAYGQTASGKTFTLTGSPTNPGIIPLAIADLFAQIRSSPDREFLLRASYLELYNETIIDLLSPEPGRELSLSEGKKKGEVVINGLTEMAVRTEEEVRRLLKMGEDRRKVGGTDWNMRSSRSHCVFRMVIESRASADTAPDRTPAGKKQGERMTRISTLSIIDLAGSERHTTSKERNAEGKHINQSLLTLKIVISKLADMAMKKNVTHVPYRDSKLTRLLQPSLSGDALISVICTISPSYLNQAESLSTLSFASGLKKVLLRAQRKELVDPQALIQQYQNEIAELRALIREKGIDGSGSGSKGQENEPMLERLQELKSRILTSSNIHEDNGENARPLSPVRLRYPRLDYDRPTGDLQEEVHEAQRKIAGQEEEIVKLKAALAARPRNPDARVLELQQEIQGFKLIADDYERHLVEPHPKVREDVEKEYLPKIAKLKDALEAKTIWTTRLHENIKALTVENKDLKMRCQDAEAKIDLIAQWINEVEANNHSGQSLSLSTPQEMPLNDFSPSLGNSADGRMPNPTLVLGSQFNLAQLSQLKGTLTMGRKGLGLGSNLGMGMGKMLREESSFDLVGASGGDDMFLSPWRGRSTRDE